MENIELPNSEEMDELWNENPPNQNGMMSDTEIRKAQLEAQRSYHRQYYHEHKKPTSCPYCGNDYSSVSSLRRHQGRSSKCQVQKLIKEVDELKTKLAGN